MTNPKEVLEWMAWKEERERNMTKEEWFCQLSTEEKAKWITENLSVYADSWVKRDEKLLNPVTWEKWLKEKHND